MATKQTKPIILKVPAFEDFRGYLAVPYDKSVDFKICQINQGYSKKAFTLRGLHFQEGEHAQAKLLYPWLICRTVKFIDWSYGTARYPLKSSKAGIVSIIGFVFIL